MREERRVGRTLELRIGVADAVPKSITYRLVEPALTIEQAVRMACREWRLDRLLAELAVHKLDLVIADVPRPSTVSVKVSSHPSGVHASASSRRVP